MHIKPIQAKIVGGTIVIAGIIVVIASINNLRLSTDKITTTNNCSNKSSDKGSSESVCTKDTDQTTKASNITLTPDSGLVGVSVTITSDTDNAFTPTDNSINFNGSKGTIVNVDSNDGKTITFNLPYNTSNLDSVNARKYSDFPIAPGTYKISVTNSEGVTTNSQDFTIEAKATVVVDPKTQTPENTSSSTGGHIDSTQNSGQN